MRYSLLIAIILFYLSSCSSTDAKINYEGEGCDDIKDAKRAILVNTSKDKLYQFTVKVLRNGISSTQAYQLFPGEQIGLGCTMYQVRPVVDSIDSAASARQEMMDGGNEDAKVTSVLERLPEIPEPVNITYEVVGQMEIKKKDK